MINQNDIKKLRMKTVMSEAFNLRNSPYQSIRDNAALKLKFLQEEFKAAFGEYSEEHVMVNEAIDSKYLEIKFKNIKAELDAIVEFFEKGNKEKCKEYLEDQIKNLKGILDKL